MAKVKIPIAERIALNGMFKKLASMLGYADAFSFDFGEQIDANTSPDFSTLYVDGTNGSDSNLGTANKPLKTIQAAFDRLPNLIKISTTIKVAPGSYTENLILKAHTRPRDVLLTVESTASTSITPTTGLATGTIASTDVSSNNEGCVITVTGAGWTVGELVGSFVELTSGSHSGYKAPIKNNTADTLIVAGPNRANQADFSSRYDGQTFKIVTPGVIITPASGNTSLAVLGWSDNVMSLGASGGTGVSTLTPMTDGILFKGMTFSNSVVRTFPGVGVEFFECKFDNHLGTTSQNSKFTFRSCYLSGSTNTTSLITSSYSTAVLLSDSVVVKGRTLVGASLGISGMVAVKNSIISNPGSDAIRIQSGSLKLVHSRVINSTYGILQEDESTWNVSSGANILLYYSDVTGHSSAGLCLKGQLNQVSIASYSEFSGNGYGILVQDSSQRSSSFNNIHFRYGSSMIFSSNTSGDIVLSGIPTPIVYADLLADPDMTMYAADTFNRVAAF